MWPEIQVVRRSPPCKDWGRVYHAETSTSTTFRRRQQAWVLRHNGEPRGCRESVRRQWQEVRSESRTTSVWNLLGTARNWAFVLGLWNATGDLELVCLIHPVHCFSWHHPFTQLPNPSGFLSPHLGGHQAFFILSLKCLSNCPFSFHSPCSRLSPLNLPGRPSRRFPCPSLSQNFLTLMLSTKVKSPA